MKYIVYVIAIALLTMLLIYIGIIKERNLNTVLLDKLYTKCCNKVLKYLKKGTVISAKEIRELISNEQTGVLWSKKKIGVTNKIQFTNHVIEGLIKLDKIQLVDDKKRVYSLKYN
ncbi:hypothetical protein [Clostridium senegalense]|uniref:hypothetical protein n=1 Tax=Clostridium senegalense TaxID=1465809 RepID=UPI0002890BE4|nr:hypothetical protein [Clostridium senegalense]MBU5225879.1 hypothetical protein [Clostridium senegalense]